MPVDSRRPDDQNGIGERRSRIRGQAERDDGSVAPAWKAIEGAQIEGVLESVLSLPDKYNPGQRQLAIVMHDEQLDESMTVYCRTVLANKLRELQPQPGDWLLIKCHGDQGRRYVNYSVYTDRPEKSGDVWGRLERNGQSPDGFEPPEDGNPPAEGTPVPAELSVWPQRP